MEKSQHSKKKKSVAIIHDFLLYPGGAEKVLQEISDMYPDAPIYTLLYDHDRMGRYVKNKTIRTSFLQKWPRFIKKHHRFLLPFYGTAVESFDLRDFDLIISSSGAWTKGVVTRLNTKHVAYVHSPMRFVWDENERYMRRLTKKKNRFCIRLLLSYLRVWDHQAAQRPDVLVANSEYTKKRIEKYYRRNADVVYPAVDVVDHQKSSTEIPHFENGYFVIVSRLSQYKNVALAIETCNKLQLPLIVIGDGQEIDQLRDLAGPTVVVKGWQNEEDKMKYIAHARALLFPAEDDFGIVCVEALHVKTPVIALGRGGAREIVCDGVTGELFDAPTVEMMADAVRRFLEKEGSYDTGKMMMEAKKYSGRVFQEKLKNTIDSLD